MELVKYSEFKNIKKVMETLHVLRS